MEDLEGQLEQLHVALSVASDEDKAGIRSIIEDLRSLIAAMGQDASNGSTQSASIALPDPDEEFIRFQEELRNIEASSGEGDEKTGGSGHGSPASEETNDFGKTENGINEELAALEGMSCKAPFMHQWGQLGYYNAVVFSVEPLNLESGEEINVRVIFTQPLSVKMRTCPYFLSGSCRFEEDCKFNHGTVVPLSHLKDYREPDFSDIVKGSRVLAKYSDDLWYPAIISTITDSGDCELSYENYGEQATIPLHDTQPLYNESEETSGSNSELSSSSESETEDADTSATEETPIMWVHMKGNSALGLWEQHTRGMGSKLMAKMGYVFGSGLGKNAEGRVEPVDAVIIPPGRSLDTVMKLKEKAGGVTSNLFSAERHLKRLQRRKKEQDAKLELKLNKSQSVFNFMNDQLNSLSKDRNHLSDATPGKSSSLTTHKESSESLSRQLVSVSDRMRSVTRDITKCRQSIQRQQGRDQTTVDRATQKLALLESQLKELKKSETKINNEQQHRNDKKKLTIF